MDQEEDFPDKVTIAVPAPSKRRAERIAVWTGKTISYFVRELPAKFEAAMLARLPDDDCRELYLKNRLKWSRAFPDKREPRRQDYKFPNDAPAGPDEVITVLITIQGREQIDRYCAFLHCTRGYVLATHFKTVERHILRDLDDDDRERFLAGEKNPRRPGPPGELLIEEEEPLMEETVH